MEFTERYLDLYVNKLISQVKRSLHDHNMGTFHQRPHIYHFTLLMWVLNVRKFLHFWSSSPGDLTIILIVFE